MTFSYRLVMPLLLPLIFAYLWWRGRRAPEYRLRWRERLARQNIPAQWRDGIVIHCVSVGETVAARSLITKLAESYPQMPLVITSMTPTGSDILHNMFAKSDFANRIHHCYLPFDTTAAMRRFFTKLAPRLVVILETELWPTMLAQSQQRNIPVLLMNARLSERSARSYQRFAWLLGPVWQQLTYVCAQTAETASRMQQLGVPADRIEVSGNLKFDLALSAALKQSAADWREQQQRPVFVAGSTHAGEDEIVLAAFAQVLTQNPSALLILVPRHPERFDKVQSLIDSCGFNSVRRSQGTAVTADTQVVLGDTMGELLFWYAVADVAFVGGSLIERGGHNPLEAVAADAVVCSGPHVFNFEAIYERLNQCNALLWANDEHELAQHWQSLLEQPDRCQVLQTAARNAFTNDTGATQRMFAVAQQHLATQTQTSGRTLAMMKTEKIGASEIWYDPELVAEASEAIFSADYWQQQQQVSGKASGRSTAWFIDSGDNKWLLRHYYRGGLVGKFNRDRFAREPIVKSRAMAEFSLLLKLRELELPVPKPVAARYERAPVWGYRADILVEVIPNAQDLFHILSERSILTETWAEVGAAIKRLHNAGVYHSDLNCHNLMLDADNKVWIVDFDKCGFKEAADWQQANLDRLRRSLRKEREKAREHGTSFHWHESAWQALLDGYAG